tara:strand:+ start:789 stop:977 length:189 start_codon:yes stop_codon:yes gene_type:complete
MLMKESIEKANIGGPGSAGGGVGDPPNTTSTNSQGGGPFLNSVQRKSREFGGAGSKAGSLLG